MSRLRLIIVLFSPLLLLPVSTSRSSAQTDDDLSTCWGITDPLPPPHIMEVGLNAGLGYVNHTGALTSPFGPTLENGSGSGFDAGVTVRVLDRDPIAHLSWEIATRLSYGDRSVRNELEVPSQTIIDGSGNEIFPEHQTVATEIDYSILNTEILYGMEVARLTGHRTLGFSLGPSFQYVVSESITYQRESTGDGKIYTDRIAYHIPDGNPIRFSVKGGIWMSWLMVRAGIYGDYGLTSTAEKDGWKVHSVMVGMDLLFRAMQWR